jgi:hypothetical protein
MSYDQFYSPCVDMKRSNSVGSEAEYSESEGFSISRKRTTIERESLKRKQAAQEYVNQLPPEITTSIKEYLPSQLSGALFCGHLVTDLDSIAGSIGAAELYGGIPARASEVNSETNFALKYWKAEVPKPIEELLEVHPQAGVCLVDHQQTSQLNKSIDVSLALYCICPVVLPIYSIPRF